VRQGHRVLVTMGTWSAVTASWEPGPEDGAGALGVSEVEGGMISGFGLACQSCRDAFHDIPGGNCGDPSTRTTSLRGTAARSPFRTYHSIPPSSHQYSAEMA